MVISQENTPEGRTGTHKSSNFSYKQVGEMVIMKDLEWPMLSYYVIYYEKFWKVMQQTEKIALTVGTPPRMWVTCMRANIDWLWPTDMLCSYTITSD